MRSVLPAVLASLGLAVGARPAVAQPATVATVNGEPITMAQWVGRMQRLRAQDFLASANPVRFKPALGGQVALEALINEKLLLQYAAKTSLLPSDAEISAAMANLTKQPAIAQALERKLVTEEQLKADLTAQQTLYNVATINQRVTADEVKAFYDKHPDLFGHPERVQLSGIRVGSKQAADKAMEALKAGTPFATVAAQQSDDASTRGKGGDLGYWAPNDPGLAQPVRDAIAKLNLGEHTEPIELGSGEAKAYLIVRLAGRQEAMMQPFEQVRPQAERLALLERAGGVGAANQKIEGFKATSTISVTLPGYEGLSAKPS